MSYVTQVVYVPEGAKGTGKGIPVDTQNPIQLKGVCAGQRKAERSKIRREAKWAMTKASEGLDGHVEIRYPTLTSGSPWSLKTRSYTCRYVPHIVYEEVHEWTEDQWDRNEKPGRWNPSRAASSTDSWGPYQVQNDAWTKEEHKPKRYDAAGEVYHDCESVSEWSETSVGSSHPCGNQRRDADWLDVPWSQQWTWFDKNNGRWTQDATGWWSHVPPDAEEDPDDDDWGTAWPAKPAQKKVRFQAQTQTEDPVEEVDVSSASEEDETMGDGKTGADDMKDGEHAASALPEPDQPIPPPGPPPDRRCLFPMMDKGKPVQPPLPRFSFLPNQRRARPKCCGATSPLARHPSATVWQPGGVNKLFHAAATRSGRHGSSTTRDAFGARVRTSSAQRSGTKLKGPQLTTGLPAEGRTTGTTASYSTSSRSMSSMSENSSNKYGCFLFNDTHICTLTAATTSLTWTSTHVPTITLTCTTAKSRLVVPTGRVAIAGPSTSSTGRNAILWCNRKNYRGDIHDHHLQSTHQAGFLHLQVAVRSID